jgi:type II restriction enzyme
MQTPKINTKTRIIPKIYAYRTPQNLEKQGWFKIGYTERDVDRRIREQTHTAGITPEKLWDYVARFNDGYYFNDHEFHAYLVRKGIPREKGTEWFDFKDDVNKSKRLVSAFVMKEDIYELEDSAQSETYVLREEQKEAVEMTASYFNERESGEFLWNAKPRFGKTLTTYDLIKQMEFNNVLILTNRPAVGNSWVDDYEKFIKYDDKYNYNFVSDSPAIAHRDIMSRDEYKEKVIDSWDMKQIAFVSLQDLKGSAYFGGDYPKLDWVREIEWDLVVIDEAHEAVDTTKTEFALERIKNKYTLHLSGTPFKQLASDKFDFDQIFNWSYMDEQEAKENWDESTTDEHNPYEELPTLNMYTYQMSNMIVDEIKQGADLDEETNVDYAFDLNEFFATDDKGNFIYEEDVIKWLDSLTRNKKYPFSTPELRNELKHTLWLLNRVDSAKALAKLLKDHPVFREYKIVSVAGDGKLEKINGEEIEVDEENIDGRNNALERVKDKIENNDKTITLTVGQLTTGVTVPEWSGVLMLSNVQSPALYMQAGFRAQNPHKWSDRDEEGNSITYRKQNAYIFDFAPERTLDIIDEFANNLNSTTSGGGGTLEEREENIKRLLNFFPVIGEDTDGQMMELDAKQVLTLPKRIKSREVVRRGFMSNLLFNNISGIFRSKKALDIINKFEKTEQGKLTTQKDRVDSEDVEDVNVDEEGNPVVDEGVVDEKRESIFGEKIYERKEIEEIVKPEDIRLTNNIQVREKLSDTLTKELEPSFNKMREEYGLTINQRKQKERSAKEKIDRATERFEAELKTQQADQKAKLEDDGVLDDSEKFEEENKKFVEESYDKLKEQLEEIVQETTKEIIEEQEIKQEEKKKNTVEDDIRANLRGFSRAIPSFIMAYGDDALTLMNFDEYVSDEVFYEVTGVTLGEFKFLRDGGSYVDDDGEEKYFKGNLFNEVVFNESIQEFLRKRSELSNYFEDNEESIYDYIPSQNTNQIYTPKWVVQKMVQQLEDENPLIYDDSSKTFIDLYMKSGLYITEVVKRLYNSEVIKSEFPDDYDRLKHILENQVYGLAPTEIIYRIATNFIFSEPTEGISRKNFAQLDAYPYAEAGTLEKKLDEVFD